MCLIKDPLSSDIASLCIRWYLLLNIVPVDYIERNISNMPADILAPNNGTSRHNDDCKFTPINNQILF